MPSRSTARYTLPFFYRKGLLLALSLTAGGCASLGQNNTHDPWLASDKALHLLAGAAIGAAGAGVAEARGLSPCAATSGGIGLAFSVGFAKEWYDSRHDSGTASSRDLIATVVGGLIGAQLAANCRP